MIGRRRLLLSAYFIVLASIIAAWIMSGIDSFSGSIAATLIAFSRLSALIGTYSILVQFVLISRAPWLEPAFGFDRLTRIHHYNGLLAFTLITAHVLLIIVGNALASGNMLIQQLLVTAGSLPFVWLALAAYLILLVTIPASIAIVKRSLKYELWYLIHLFNYAVILLALWHQVVNGTTLISQDWLRYGWYGLHGLVLMNLVVYRFVRPVKLSRKHRFRVERIEQERGGVCSIYVSGRQMDQFSYRSGQFMKWRFLQKGFWKEEHPFTVSVEPNGKYLRLTAKSIGDYTEHMSDIRPGTQVVISGPLGTFTLESATGRKLLFIAGGIGITPLRAMMGAADKRYDITLIYAAKSRAELSLKGELDELAEQNGFAIVYVLSGEKASGYGYGRIDERLLLESVMDLADREAYICGPPPMMSSVADVLRGLGVDSGAIHTERFEL